MSKFPKGICATQEKTSRKEGKKTGLKMRQPKGGWNDNLSLAYQKYILNHLALLPEPKLEKVKILLKSNTYTYWSIITTEYILYVLTTAVIAYTTLRAETTDQKLPQNWKKGWVGGSDAVVLL